jgi:hypothetical protein
LYYRNFSGGLARTEIWSVAPLSSFYLQKKSDIFNCIRRPAREEQQSEQVVEEDGTAAPHQPPSLHTGRYTGYRLSSLIQDLNCSESIIVRPNDE